MLLLLPRIHGNKGLVIWILKVYARQFLIPLQLPGVLLCIPARTFISFICDKHHRLKSIIYTTHPLVNHISRCLYCLFMPLLHFTNLCMHYFILCMKNTVKIIHIWESALGSLPTDILENQLYNNATEGPQTPPSHPHVLALKMNWRI